MKAANAVQSALFTRLSAIVTSATVYDDVPDLPEGEPFTDFPYIVIGNDTSVSWDTDDVLGETVTCTLHVFSRYQGKKEAKTILAEIYDALHRQAGNLSATGYRFVDCLLEFSEIFDDDDGATRHGVCRYRLTVEQE